MAASRLSHFRAVQPLLRLIIFVLAAIATILSGAAYPIANSPDFYADGLAPAMIVIVIPLVSLNVTVSKKTNKSMLIESDRLRDSLDHSLGGCSILQWTISSCN